MTNPDLRALCAELLADYDNCHYRSELSDRARAALAQQHVSQPCKLPEPVAPTNEELDRFADEVWSGSPRRYARAVLARWGTPAIQPVPVSERLPDPDDCDAEGMCWLCGTVEGDWRLIDPANSGVPQLKYCFSHWLPHWALPVPAPANNTGGTH
jgi:hypothetical protein